MARVAAQQAFDDEHEQHEEEPEKIAEAPPAPVGPAPEETEKEVATPALVTTLEPLRRPFRVKVNGVGITIPVAAYHVTERSICLVIQIVAGRDWDLDLPITTDVVVMVDGTDYKAAYLGGFHSFPALGIQTVYFPRPEEDSGIDTQAGEA